MAIKLWLECYSYGFGYKVVGCKIVGKILMAIKILAIKLWPWLDLYALRIDSWSIKRRRSKIGGYKVEGYKF